VNDVASPRFVFVAVAGAVLIGAGSRASAYEIDTSSSCPSGYTYPTDRTLTFYYTNIPASDEQFQFLVAGPAIADRISNIGAQYFDFITPYSVSTTTYALGRTPNNLTEAGVTDLSGLAIGTGAAPIGYTQTAYDDTTCQIVEADIFMDDDTVTWYVPAHYGVPFYGAGMSVVSGGTTLYYARGPFLHEMLHGLGFNHSDSSYSFMNYNVLPWANRGDEEDMVDPLPDDREGMRAFYGNSNTQTDLGVLMTWYSDQTSFKASLDKLLCAPSTGVDYSPSQFDPTCGVDATGASGSTEVCPGDTLYVRYALVNYGNTDVTVDEELWFSLNDNLNRTAGLDIVSPTTRAAHVSSANTSVRWGRRYAVPSGLNWDTDYYPIIWLDTAGVAERSDQNNWIPLRATIHIKPQASCP
jgi:hypothetical protein